MVNVSLAIDIGAHVCIQILFHFSAPCMIAEVWQAPLRREERAEDLPGADSERTTGRRLCSSRTRVGFTPSTLAARRSSRTPTCSMPRTLLRPRSSSRWTLEQSPAIRSAWLPVAIQPNSHDCGYHVVLNSRLLADFVLGFNVEGGDKMALAGEMGPAYINTARGPLIIPQELSCRGRGPPGVRF